VFDTRRVREARPGSGCKIIQLLAAGTKAKMQADSQLSVFFREVPMAGLFAVALQEEASSAGSGWLAGLGTGFFLVMLALLVFGIVDVEAIRQGG
jgi:hypothetical protein